MPECEVVCDLTAHLLTEVGVDQVLPTFHSVLLLVCQ